EGGTNVVRHSGARHARIGVKVSDAGAEADLTDDGAGPAASATGAAGLPGPTGAGLAGLAERAARLGGTLRAGAGERGGFRLRISVPLPAPQVHDLDGPPAAADGDPPGSSAAGLAGPAAPAAPATPGQVPP